ncbi:DNA-repair protein XRCC1-like [Chenopodium quinoa]|uniref:BRCT domain-containing protein n=1 Tax=Chenopodium quinoa TaxID=63459 RepID=A0A803LNA1_CHEQI|nr:DNA-repair protein XRCC1-like [Chenopodium quinoa]
MSSSKASSSSGTATNPKRALPSWMSARDDGNGDKQVNDRMDDDSQVKSLQKRAREEGKGVNDDGEEKLSSVGPNKLEFSKLLEGVVFALSGFVNPERGILRSQALEMGAEYQQDWNSKCTLLVCAFRNTPKFRQVEADGGTIVSKDWLTECYTQKKLVDIETYLMHVGNPWRKSNITHTGNQVSEKSRHNKSRNHEVKRPEVESSIPSSPKGLRENASKGLREKFAASKVKKWAVDDLNRTLTWLESQEEKPEPSEIRNVAAEGILICLEEAIDLLDKEQDLQHLTEQWNIVPRAVEELIEVQGAESSFSISKADLHKQALACKKIYEGELKEMPDGSSEKNREQKSTSRNTRKGKQVVSADDIAGNSVDYDSDETIEMTEDEINDAYNSIASKIPSL